MKNKLIAETPIGELGVDKIISHLKARNHFIYRHSTNSLLEQIATDKILNYILGHKKSFTKNILRRLNCLRN